MSKHTVARILTVVGMIASVVMPGVASAIDVSVTGFVREEISYGISSYDDNPNNTAGRKYLGLVTPHFTYGGAAAGYGGPAFDASGTNWLTPTTTYFNPALAGNPTGGRGGLFAAGLVDTLPAGAFTSSPADCAYGYHNAIAAGSTGFAGTGTFFGSLCPNGAGANGAIVIPGRIAGAADQTPSAQGGALLKNRTFNTFNTRLDVDTNIQFSSEFAAFIKARIYYDGTRMFEHGPYGDNFGNPFWSDRRATLLEWNSPDFLIDIPVAYLDWNRGPMWVRVGNQTIAWGEAYFFRVTDLANGLDLRRHLTLGPGAEEYQDQRVASPGVRVSYRFYKEWELDAFAQMFQPTILPGQNTAYNLVPTTVWLDEDWEFEQAKNTMNFGFRLNAPLNDSFTVMAGYVNRRNPDGVATSVDAPTMMPDGMANPFCLGANNHTNNLLTGLGLQGARAGLGIPAMPATPTQGRRGANGCGSTYLPHPHAAGAQEFWDVIMKGRLDPSNYAIRTIEEWPGSQWATREIFGFGQELSFADLYRTLEGFRSNFGGISQMVGREFKRENVFFGGFNYITETEDGGFLDSIIIRGEVSVTPNKKLMNDLSLNFTEKDDIVSALILEKYHRFNMRFPATYMVAQWMHRTATDMFGRDLAKNDAPGLDKFVDPVTGDFTPLASVPGAMTPDGNDMADYVVFAFQQPFPNLVWRIDMSLLIDTAGGYLIQPGVRYRPSASMQWDLYSTVIQSPGGDNDTITETLDFADEVFLRATYFF